MPLFQKPLLEGKLDWLWPAAERAGLPLTIYLPNRLMAVLDGERFGATPPITGQCETCGTKVVVRRDAPRLLLTVLPRDEVAGRRPSLPLD